MLADGGEAIADIDVLRRQLSMLVPVASPPTAWRTLDEVTGARLKKARLRGPEPCVPNALRYRVLHTPAQLTHGARRRRLRIPQSWSWAAAIVAVFANLAAIPRPA